jgi:hypothetical protein
VFRGVLTSKGILIIRVYNRMPSLPEGSTSRPLIRPENHQKHDCLKDNRHYLDDNILVSQILELNVKCNI